MVTTIGWNISAFTFGSTHFTVKHRAYAWACLLYTLIIISIGVCLPVTMGWELARTQNALDRYLEFYIFLYSVGIGYFVFYHFTADTLTKCFRCVVNSCTLCIERFWKKPTSLPKNNTEIQLSEVRENSIDEKEDEHKLRTEKSSGHFGLKCGVKAAVIVFLIMILMELSTFTQARINGIKCHVDAKGIFVVLQLFYVLLQTFFVLKPSQETIERFSVINHLGVAHLIGTTICTGFLLTAYDCLLKLYSFQQGGTVFNASNFTNTTFNAQNLPSWIVQNKRHWEYRKEPVTSHRGLKRRAVGFCSIAFVLTIRAHNLSTDHVVDTSPCSLKSYLNSIQSQMKPFTYTIIMFYVFCSSILLFLLFFHIRKKLNITSSSTTTASVFFKIINPKAATFSSGAGLSLIVLSMIISILTLNANDNVYAEIFLLFIHTQASIVGLIALWRIADIPCRKKFNQSKYPTIYLIFFFFVLLAGALEIIGKSKELFDENDEVTYIVVLEIIMELVDIFQALLHGVLILVGFMVEVCEEALIKQKMPKKILIHLAASNFAALLSGIFSSKVILFNNMQKVLKANERSEVSARIAWTVLATILDPCEEFNRFTTIIYLIKLYKTWSMNYEAEQINNRNISRISTASTTIALQ